MEEELRCLACKHLFEKPVLLPCSHALCLTCALGLQQPVAGSEADSVTSSSSGDYTEADKVSILSETDSGVVCGSRPSSYVGSSNINGTIFPPTALFLTCPICQKPVYFDENGANNLPKYRVMQRIIDKFGDGSTNSESVHNCQMCEEDPPKAASVHCEQCSVLYCDSCRESCHPSRGPLSRHTLVLAGRRDFETGCAEHGGAPLVAHCTPCRQPACSRCLQERHVAHDVQQLTVACKTQKTELSQNLQLLSEKALAMTEYIQRVKTLAEKVNESYTDFETIVTVQCETLIEAIRMRRELLLQSIRDDRDCRVRDMKEQAATCTRRLQSATGLLQFCIEALKETESAAFLQVGSLLAGRAAGVGVECARILQAAPRPPPQRPDLTLDDRPLLAAISHLNFIQMKPAMNGEDRQPAAPGAPGLAPELCAAENNSVTVAWVQPVHSHVEGYVLELDDGHGGDFREVYCGKETMCTVDGLHFNSLYNARVKAFNATGEGIYSELIGLQTAPVAWFSWEGGGRPDGLSLYGSGLGTRVAGWEHRVALAGVGLSRGVHYWRLIVDRYDADTDPAFGVARADVSRDKMLGKDNSGWAMYIDGSRSWFQHGGAHHSRQEGGISAGSEVGVLLDLDNHTLSFTVDGLPQGGIAFTDLYGVFYPAVSLNRGVAVTLCPALEPPSDVDEP